MSCEKLKKFLDEKGIKYVTITHSQAFTAQQVAASTHIKGKDMAKTVIIKIDGHMAMAVLPANYQIDFQALKEVTGNENVVLAEESEFKDIFDDCETGAMPPFGNLYGMDVFVAESLTKDDEIVFNAGNHSEVIKMKYSDFEKLVKPKIIKFAT